MSSIAMAVAMLAAFALIAGGVRMARKREDRRRAILMIVAATVLIGNVLIWTI